MLTPTTLRDRFPEWENAPDTLVQACLDEAYTRLGTADWAHRLDIGAGYLTSILLTRSPYGRNLAQADDDGKTVYDTQWLRLCRIVGVTPIVI